MEPDTPFPAPQNDKRTSPWLVPIAILLSGLMIACAVYLTRSDDQVATGQLPGNNQPAGSDTVNVRPVAESDHIRGNPDADIVIIEYSDYECPFCSQFHTTMKNLMEKYGKDGQLAWVYRHFPIEQLHPNAWRIAIASECAAELGGNDAFWQFSDSVFAEMAKRTQANPNFDMTQLSDFVEEIGLSREAFNACMESERTRPLVQEDYDEAVGGAGGTGTPHNVIIAAGQTAAIPGAQPPAAMEAMIQSVLRQTGNQ